MRINVNVHALAAALLAPAGAASVALAAFGVVPRGWAWAGIVALIFACTAYVVARLESMFSDQQEREWAAFEFGKLAEVPRARTTGRRSPVDS